MEINSPKNRLKRATSRVLKTGKNIAGGAIRNTKVYAKGGIIKTKSFLSISSQIMIGGVSGSVDNVHQLYEGLGRKLKYLKKSDHDGQQ